MHFHRLAPLICLLLAILTPLTAAETTAGLSGPLDAVCRIQGADGTMGTGCVFEIGQGAVFVLTNRHVAQSRSPLACTFWRAGHESIALRATVLAQSEAVDVALLALRAEQFGGQLPRAIPLAPRGTQLTAGETICSAGCAKGAWATAWKGHVLGYENGHLVFTPPPADGRSGSAICTAAGERIVGLIWGRSDQESRGYAVSLENLYRSLRFQRSSTGQWIHKPEPLLTQCGPGGCQVLPYRRYELWEDGQQNQRLGQIEGQLNRIWPTLPPTGQPYVPQSAGSVTLDDLDRRTTRLRADVDQLQQYATNASSQIASRITSEVERQKPGLISTVVSGVKAVIFKYALGSWGGIAVIGVVLWWFLKRDIQQKVETGDPLAVQKGTELLKRAAALTPTTLDDKLAAALDGLVDRLADRIAPSPTPPKQTGS